ncbi:MAG TPA: hypothetical protein VET84_10330 [Stellaceae bacterium]|nr:hypothetical protein [Stellaceae bacterium]
MKRRKTARAKWRSRLSAVPATAAHAPVADTYETDVAPDLIDAGCSPDRSKAAPDAACSLPPRSRPGRGCP